MAIEAMEAELVVLKNESASAKPLTARLDYARAQLRKAEAKVESAQQALDKLKAEHANALASVETARSEFRALEEEFRASSGETAQSPADVLDAASALLGVLETICVPPGSTGPPERLVESMQRLRGAMKEPKEADIPVMELSPASPQAEQAPGAVNAAHGETELAPIGRGPPSQSAAAAGWSPY